MRGLFFVCDDFYRPAPFHPSSPPPHRSPQPNKWSPEEVALLLRLCAEHKAGNWALIQAVGGWESKRTQVGLGGLVEEGDSVPGS